MAFDLRGFGNNVAIFLEDKSTFSYLELDEMVGNFVKRFSRGRGLLLLEASNSLNSIVSYLAALRAHCPIVLTSPSSGKNSILSKISFSFLYHYSASSDELFVTEGSVEMPIDPQLVLMLSTSGSTGAAKYVCLSWDNLRSNALSIAEYLGLSEEDRAPTNLPIYYSYGLSIVNSHLMAGGALFLTDMSVMVKTFWELFDHFKCTSFAGVPHTYNILDRLRFPTSERTSLRYSTQAGGKLSKELIVKNARNAQKEGWKFFVMYGQTEASPRMSYLPPELALTYPGCIGVPIPRGRFSIEDADGRVVDEHDVEGELVYTGPNVMLGYALGDEDLAAFDRQPRLKTGDLACINNVGLYYITGRKSRFMKIYGVRVSWDQVEDYLSELGYNAVCGGTDETLNILITDNADVNEIRSKIAQWLGIPLLKVRIITIDQIPVKSNGKTDIQKANAIISEKIG